jgi:hypothetical protein
MHSLLFLDKYFLRNRAIWPRFVFDWYFVYRNPGTKIKEPGTSSSFVFLHLLHNISFGIFRKIRGQMARFLKKYLSKNNKLCILLILEIQALKWCNIYLTDIWFKSYTWSKQIFWYKLSSFLPLKNTVLPRFRVSNVNIFFKTLYQIKAFNIFFVYRNPGTKIKEPGTSSSFVFLHLLHNISFGIFRKIKGDNLA